MAITAEAIQIPVEDQIMSGRLHLPDSQPRQLGVLLLHGWRGTPNDRAAEALAAAGYPAMTYVMRGHSGQGGDDNEAIRAISRQDSLDDAVAAHDSFQDRLGPETRMVVAGHSYGGYIAILLSQRRPAIAGLSLRAAADYPNKGFTKPQFGQGHNNPAVMKFRRTYTSIRKNWGYEALRQFQGPVQILEAKDDKLIPPQTTGNYLRAAARTASPRVIEYTIMEGEHRLHDDPDRNAEYQAHVIGWLNKLDKSLTNVY